MTGLEIYTCEREMWIEVVPRIARKTAIRMLDSLPFALARQFYILAGLETFRWSFLYRTH